MKIALPKKYLNSLTKGAVLQHVSFFLTGHYGAIDLLKNRNEKIKLLPNFSVFWPLNLCLCTTKFCSNADFAQQNDEAMQTSAREIREPLFFAR